jgi:hypothetical protein
MIGQRQPRWSNSEQRKNWSTAHAPIGGEEEISILALADGEAPWLIEGVYQCAIDETRRSLLRDNDPAPRPRNLPRLVHIRSLGGALGSPPSSSGRGAG